MENTLGQQTLHTCHHLVHRGGGVQMEAGVHVQRQGLHLGKRHQCIGIRVRTVEGVLQAHLPAQCLQHEG